MKWQEEGRKRKDGKEEEKKWGEREKKMKGEMKKGWDWKDSSFPQILNHINAFVKTIEQIPLLVLTMYPYCSIYEILYTFLFYL